MTNKEDMTVRERMQEKLLEQQHSSHANKAKQASSKKNMATQRKKFRGSEAGTDITEAPESGTLRNESNDQLNTGAGGIESSGNDCGSDVSEAPESGTIRPTSDQPPKP